MGVASPSTPLLRVFAWCLATVIGGTGWLAVSFGPSLWHVLVGIPAVFLAVSLLCSAQNGG